jgi:hypothetical protein
MKYQELDPFDIRLSSPIILKKDNDRWVRGFWSYRLYYEIATANWFTLKEYKTKKEADSDSAYYESHLE